MNSVIALPSDNNSYRIIDSTPPALSMVDCQKQAFSTIQDRWLKEDLLLE